MNPVSQGSIPAWAEAEDELFYHPAADQVTDDGRHNQRERPDPALFPEVKGRKDQEEKVEGNPDFRLTQKGQNRIKKMVGPLLVDLIKQPMVELQNRLKQRKEFSHKNRKSG